MNVKIYEHYKYMLPYIEEVNRMCTPFLKQYKLDHFWYSRVYKDGSFIDLGIDNDWFKYVLENKYYDFWNEMRTFPEFWPEKKTKFISTPENFSLDLNFRNLDIIINKYKIFYIFNIFINRGEYLENFAFSAPQENYESISIYSRYFGILYAFGMDFTKKASYIIKDVESQGKIYFPCLLSSIPRNLHLINQKVCETTGWLQENIKHFFISTSTKEDISITPRQRECLSYLALGKNYKEISRILGIDIKTVDNHMQRLRDKTGLSSRSDLVKAFIESGI